jgi:uncharacterized protein YdeI (YjbR/CyaY-like superfamily)
METARDYYRRSNHERGGHRPPQFKALGLIAIAGLWILRMQSAGTNVETGDRVKLSLRIASEELPAELARLIKNNQFARARWERFTPGHKRMLREEVLAAKQPATRERRATRALGLL